MFEPNEANIISVGKRRKRGTKYEYLIRWNENAKMEDSWYLKDELKLHNIIQADIDYHFDNVRL